MTTRDDRFESAYTQHYRRLIRYYVRVFRLSEADAQELTQDTFVRFYKAMDDYAREAEWALLDTIARNVGFNHMRSQSTKKRGGVRPESLDDGEAGKDAGDPFQRHPIDVMIEAEQLHLAKKTMIELPIG